MGIWFRVWSPTASYAAIVWEGFEVMDNRQRLREIVARLCRVPQEEILSGFPIAPLVARSINVHLLESALRKQLGVELPPLQTIRTYAELESQILEKSDQGGSSRPPMPDAGSAVTAIPVALAAAGGPATPACGLDLESIANFPVTEDPWTHEFYTNSFTSAEIAYSVSQAHPRRHFAARWCAKEALKKCDPVFLHEKMDQIQVMHDERGAPLFQLVRTGQVLPHALSITHNEIMASAIVVHLGTAPSDTNAASHGAPEKTEARRVDEPQSRVSAALVFAILATAVACLALLRSYGF
jgi:phosphopantetheine--protein transferase-like protein